MYGLLECIKQLDAKGSPHPGTDKKAVKDELRARIAADAAIGRGLIAAGLQASGEDIAEQVRRSLEQAAGKDKNLRGLRLVRHMKNKNVKCGLQLAASISSVGWLYGTAERTREVARAVGAAVNASEEETKSAECVASMICDSRSGEFKPVIISHAMDEFGLDLDRLDAPLSTEGVLKDEKAQLSYALTPMCSMGIRDLCALQDDPMCSTDAMCIAMHVAEGYFGADQGMKLAGNQLLRSLGLFDMANAVNEMAAPCEGMGFNQEYVGDPDDYNPILGEALDIGYNLEFNLQSELAAAATFKSLKMGGKLIVPLDLLTARPPELESVAKSVFLGGQSNPVKVHLSARPSLVSAWDMGWPADTAMPRLVAMFTDCFELRHWHATRRTVSMTVRDALEMALEVEGMEGIIVDPFSDGAVLDKVDIARILSAAGASIQVISNAQVVPLKREEDLMENETLEQALVLASGKNGPSLSVLDQPGTENLSAVENALLERALHGGHLIVCYAMTGDFVSRRTMELTYENCMQGLGTLEITADMMTACVRTRTGDYTLSAFTSADELAGWTIGHETLEVTVEEALQMALDASDKGGIVLNAFSSFVELNRNRVELLLRKIRETRQPQA